MGSQFPSILWTKEVSQPTSTNNHSHHSLAHSHYSLAFCLNLPYVFSFKKTQKPSTFQPKNKQNKTSTFQVIQAVTFLSPSWRSLIPLKGSRFHHPKKVTIAESPGRFSDFFIPTSQLPSVGTSLAASKEMPIQEGKEDDLKRDVTSSQEFPIEPTTFC